MDNSLFVVQVGHRKKKDVFIRIQSEITAEEQPMASFRDAMPPLAGTGDAPMAPTGK
jgi:hypothetical protein